MPKSNILAFETNDTECNDIDFAALGTMDLHASDAPPDAVVVDGTALCTTVLGRRVTRNDASDTADHVEWVVALCAAECRNLIEKHRGVAIDWVFDSRNNRDYRNTILNGYKHGRVQQFDPSVRRSVLQQVIQWLRDSNESVVTLDRFEADDAMADLVRHYASQCKRVLLYSRDSDLAQLQYIPSAQEYLRFNPPRDPPCGTIEFWWNTKAAIGDIGDNVHGLHGIGAKHATLESGKRVATAAAMESVGSGAHVQHSVARVIERNVRCVRL